MEGVLTEEVDGWQLERSIAGGTPRALEGDRLVLYHLNVGLHLLRFGSVFGRQLLLPLYHLLFGFEYVHQVP